ncbi:MAG: EAL domain-containing protein [Roseibium sp.]
MSKKSILLSEEVVFAVDDAEALAEKVEALRAVAEEHSLPDTTSWDAHSLWFDQIAEYISDPVFMKDRSSRFVMVNEALRNHFSVNNADPIIGKSDLELHPPEIGLKFFDEEQNLMATNEALVGHEEFVYLPDGEVQWLSTTKVPVSDRNGNIIGLFGIARDITRRKTSELLRGRQSKVLEMIAAGVPLTTVLDELLLLVEEHLRGTKASILLLEPGAKSLHHGSAPSLSKEYCSAIDGITVGQKSGSCGAAAHRGEDVIASDISNDPLWRDHKVLALAHGLKSCASTPIISPTGRILGSLAIYSDKVSTPDEVQQALTYETARIAAIAIERDLAESKIRFLAENDPLSELPNRNMLENQIQELVKADVSGTQNFSLVFVDLDKFKHVNDSLGHSAGDKVIQIVADRLVNCLRPTDFVARFGGDEFVILLKNGSTEPDKIRMVLERIQEAINEPIDLESQTFEICSSLGISLYPQDGKDAKTLLKHADHAMYEAKALGRNCYRFYSAKLAAEDAAKLTLLQEIRVGIREEQFFLEFQPQFDLLSNQMTGVEALVRWNHPTRGRVPPDKFILAAEESGLISELGNWVLLEACRQGSEWQKFARDPIVISVNVSAHQFFSGDLIDKINDALDQTGLDPRLLELELTESSIITDPDHCIQTMETLRDMGVRIALDDFGTGYSSLSTLSTFPLNKLKIDRSFIQNMDKGNRELGIARAIIALGQELEMRVIAEGVETENQMDQLKALNCNDVQGYFTGRPMHRGMIDGLLSDQYPNSLN